MQTSELYGCQIIIHTFHDQWDLRRKKWLAGDKNVSHTLSTLYSVCKWQPLDHGY